MGNSLRPGRLLRRALRGGVARASLAGSGVAAAALLALALLAAYRGATSGVAAYVGQVGFDLWVAPRGIDNLVRSAGQLPAGAEEAVRAIDGVAEVGPILRSFAAVEGGPAGDRRRLTLLAIGYRGPSGLGGPPFLVAGRAPASPDEIALDRAAAHRLGVGPGATVDVAGDRARVVGLTRGTNLLATQFAFVDHQAADDALGAMGRPSFLVVRLAPGAPVESVKKSIEERVPRSAAFSRDEFVDNNVREISAGVLPVLALVTGLGFAVAVALVALLAQGLADDRRRDVAVLLALGASARAVGLGVLAHVEKVVFLGAAAGAAAAWVTSTVLDLLAPTVELSFRATDPIVAPLAFGAAAALAALGPVLRLARIDPVEAFRP
jgi:putative ABC transport system permease protein